MRLAVQIRLGRTKIAIITEYTIVAAVIIPKFRTRGIGERNSTAKPQIVVRPEINKAEPVRSIVVSIACLSLLCSISSLNLYTT